MNNDFTAQSLMKAVGIDTAWCKNQAAHLALHGGFTDRKAIILTGPGWELEAWGKYDQRTDMLSFDFVFTFHSDAEHLLQGKVKEIFEREIKK